MSFSAETFQFLKNLAANNSKDWFEDNRSVYEALWRDPALTFIERLIQPMAAMPLPLKAEARLNGSLRRINRDTRFSKDKAPYAPSLHLIFWAGAHPNRSVGFHLVLQPEGVGYGAGWFAIPPDNLTQIRSRILDKNDGNALISATGAAEAVGCRFGPPELARLPRGLQAEGARADLLRRKTFVVSTFDNPAPAETVIGAAAHDWTLSTCQSLLPFMDWLHASDA